MTHTQSTCRKPTSEVQKSNTPLIYGEDISVTFNGAKPTKALESITFGINENKITAIIGESGSGKSTLLKTIYGLIEPDSGEVRYKGWLVPTPKDKLIPGHDAMKLVSQNFEDLNIYAKVWDNIASQLSNTDLRYKEVRTTEMLEKLRIDHLAQHRVSDLSGGEKQRVAIARALINEPEVLLLDEPFNQVDAAFRDNLQQDICNIVKESNLTVLIVSHDPAEVLAMADNLLVLKNGKLIDQGSPMQVYYEPKHPYSATLLAKSNIILNMDAHHLNIESSKTIAIHREWLNATLDNKGTFTIVDIKFRGFYQEYLLQKDDFILHALIKTKVPIPKGSSVSLEVENFISFV